jgi:hypothetical protein
MNNYRVNNYGSSSYDQGRLAYSSMSRNCGVSNRSMHVMDKDVMGDDNNLVELEYML